MCSTAGFGPDTPCGQSDEPTMLMKTKTNKRTDVCFKCKTNRPFVMIRRGDPFCEPCFDAHVIHKFRKGLGKTKVLYAGDTVVLNLTGSLSSLAMLHLMATGYTGYKKITANPKLLIVDDSSLFHQAESPVPALLRVIQGLTADMPRQTIVMPFELIFCANFEGVCSMFYEDNKDKLIVDFKEMDGVDLVKLSQTARHVFTQTKTLTSREDISRSLHRQILCKTAKILSSTKIMSSENATDLASRLLSAVSYGQGVYIPNETNYLDTRLNDVVFINCMREFTPKECCYYLKRLNVEPITLLSHGSLADPIVGSIYKVAYNFISGLQAASNGTVSTVMRTAAKLQAVSCDYGNCDVCLLPLSKGSNEGGMGQLSLCEGCQISNSELEPGVIGVIARNRTDDVLNEFLL